MLSYVRYLLAGLIAIFSASAIAQTEFEKIDVGTVLTKAGIKLGVFAKPIPLPEGEWKVVSKRIEELQLTRGDHTSTSPAKRIWLTLKNNQASASPIFAIVMHFTPEAFNINWGNRKCENTKSNALVDDFSLSPDSVTYVCGTAWSLSSYKKRVASASESTSNWDKNNLVALSTYAEDIPDKVLEVSFYANQYRGRNMGFSFLMKREGDFQTDPAYAQYVKDWTHAAGLSLMSVLKNDAATFSLPTPFVAQAAQ